MEQGVGNVCVGISPPNDLLDIEPRRLTIGEGTFRGGDRAAEAILEKVPAADGVSMSPKEGRGVSYKVNQPDHLSFSDPSSNLGLAIWQGLPQE